ncbi:dynamin family protein [Pandoraea apista]|uniref:dynamin family protein n=1 Tax=Pandoraea apista TaxID=93218 RepID=UPI00058AB7A6|nr:dynamin family protein [Pandoraea apista]AJF00187.1 hypothetical protein SG18_22040 [Pandoraea apista]AKH74349.1 hypothetical protein XM39_22220 [Pandoraea apista]AKI62898.1 hypothetical protein AA956_15545 [Pandoraea apista]
MASTQHVVSPEIAAQLQGLLEKFDELRSILDTSPADFRLSQYCDEEPALVRDTTLDAIHRVRLAIFDLISSVGAAPPLDSSDTFQAMRSCLDEIPALISQLDLSLRRESPPSLPEFSRHVTMFIDRVEDAVEIVRCSLSVAYAHADKHHIQDTSDTPAETQLDELLLTCALFGFSSLQERAEVLVNQRTSSALHVLLVGRACTGKTSLTNLMAPTANLPTGPIPTTAATTLVESAKEKACVRILFSNGSIAETPPTQLDEFLNFQWNKHNSKHVALATVDLPRADLCDGLVVIDSPGIDGVESGGWWWRASPYFDLAILVTDAHGPCNLDLRIASRAVDLGGELAVLINKADQLSLREQWSVLEHADKSIRRTLGKHTAIYLSSAKGEHKEMNSLWIDGFIKGRVTERPRIKSDVRSRRINNLRRDVIATLNAKIRSLESKCSTAELEICSTRCHQALSRASHCLDNPPCVGMTGNTSMSTIREAVSEASENIAELARRDPEALIDPAPLILASIRSRVSSDADCITQQLRQREAAFREFIAHARQAMSDTHTDFDGPYPRVPKLPEIDFGRLTAGRFCDELTHQSRWRPLKSRVVRALTNLKVPETLESWTCDTSKILNESAQGWSRARLTWLNNESIRLTDPRNSVAMRLSAMRDALARLTGACTNEPNGTSSTAAGVIRNNT